MLSQMHSSKSPATTDHNHHRYRRNSYTKSIDNGPAPLDYSSDGGGVDHRGMPVSRSMGSGGGLDGRPQMPLPQVKVVWFCGGVVGILGYRSYVFYDLPGGHFRTKVLCTHRTVIEVNNLHPSAPTSQPPPMWIEQ